MSGIYTLHDLRSLAPPELRNASDSVLINEYAKDLGVDPTEVARYFGYNNSGGMASNRIAAGIDTTKPTCTAWAVQWPVSWVLTELPTGWTNVARPTSWMRRR